jgi:hypothetical protein
LLIIAPPASVRRSDRGARVIAVDVSSPMLRRLTATVTARG